MTAIEIGRFAPDSPEWHEARRARLGGSEIAAVLGLSPYESRFSLWHKKTGAVEPSPTSPAMEVGRYVEDAIATWFQDQHPDFVVRSTGTWVHSDRPWQLANPDRLIFDARAIDEWGGCAGAKPEPIAILEVKYSMYGDGFGATGTDEIPVHYACQTRWYSDVFDGLPVYVAGLIGGQFGEWYIEQDEGDALLMREAGRGFLESIAAGERPDIDDSYATLETVRRLHPDILDGSVEMNGALQAKYVAALGAYKAAKAAKDEATALVLDELGDWRNATCDGQRFAYRTARPNSDGTPGTPYLATDWRSLSRQQKESAA